MARALEYGWHDGQLRPLSEIHISPLDRGFLFGDGVYEVIPVYNGRALGLAEHLGRLNRSLHAIDLPAPCEESRLVDSMEQVITANSSANQSLYIQISRAGDDGRDHKFPRLNEASLFMMSSTLVPASRTQYSAGFPAITLPDDRWQRCDIKSTSMLANVMARQAASKADALEAVLTRDDYLIEGAASAIICARDGVIYAPPETNTLLPSVTRHITLDIAKRLDIEVRVEPIPIDFARDADELLLMSSTKEIVPLVQLDGARIGKGQPGPIWNQLFDGYQDRKVAL
ncbi:MAG: aminotransferase class IV [Pseudomonadota bacterium]